MLNDVTFCILAKNEGANLAELLPRLLRISSNILVFDTGSTDETVDVALRFNVKIMNVPWSNNFTKVRNIILNSVETTWIFMIDADERFTPELEEEVLIFFETDPELNGYYIPRKNYYLGKWLRHGGQYPDYQLKLLKKEKAKYDRLVHEHAVVEGRVGYLRSHLLHYPYPTVSQYLKKFDFYSTLEAEILYQSGYRAGAGSCLSWMVIKPWTRFIKRYFLKGGFLDGIPGAFAAIFDALGYVVRFIKLWEMQKTKAK